jgi:hypothetical protein
LNRYSFVEIDIVSGMVQINKSAGEDVQVNKSAGGDTCGISWIKSDKCVEN